MADSTLHRNEIRALRIGLIGLGTVGQGVWKHMEANGEALGRRIGTRFELVKAAVRDTSKPREIAIPPEKITDDVMAVATDPEIDIVCELAGGKGIAKEATLAALRAGKVVVTANKALLCDEGAALFEAAREGNGHYFFEASVAGGIPIIKTIREGLVANRFSRIFGILNGTCNYILTRMERERKTFDEIVVDARRLGYVEADESLDLDGWDTAHKAIILAFLAHGRWVPLADVPVSGIRRITLEDIERTRELGFKVKLLATIERDFGQNTLAIKIAPALVRADSVIGGVDDVFNAVSVTGDVVGTTTHIGRGAGQDATASSVISDIADAAAALLGSPPPVVSEEDTSFYSDLGEGITLADPKDVTGRYYLRLTVADRPGVLAQVATITARRNVSIATVDQHPAGDRQASLILTTHDTCEQAVADTLTDLNALDTVVEEPLVMRIVDFEE